MWKFYVKMHFHTQGWEGKKNIALWWTERSSGLKNKLQLVFMKKNIDLISTFSVFLVRETRKKSEHATGSG